MRVLVWGPGGLGTICIREVLRLGEFELAGVLAYSVDKDGVDAGTLAGVEPAGVLTTTDIRRALDVDCDAVVHLARDYGRFSSLPHIVEFLRAGRNVVSVHPFQHAEAMRFTSAPADTIQQLEAACLEGGATFHATGIHPGACSAGVARRPQPQRNENARARSQLPRPTARSLTRRDAEALGRLHADTRDHHYR
jgi:2,4-diaminopentanoate dehydrogenase